MKYIDLSLSCPAANLACDEAMLDLCERAGTEVLRFWQTREVFVVVGFANSVSREVKQNDCEREGVGIYRRCSGGGTVLQGPGCLNYALALRSERGELDTIPAANRFIMERHRRALASVLGRPVEVRGHTDLAIEGRKFSGNSQRRKRQALLFHGTFLLNFDLRLVERFLAMPSREPQYRAGRGHQDFLTNAGGAPDSVKKALRNAWEAEDILEKAPEWQGLTEGKYSRREWNLKF